MRTRLQELDLRWSRAMFGRWGQKNAHQTVAKKRKTSGVQRRVESFPLSRSVAIVDLRDTPAMRVCKWCVKTYWHGSESISTATLIIVLLLYCAGL